jgi:formylglycine-generating enzyme required for sulfatase activity
MKKLIQLKKAPRLSPMLTLTVVLACWGQTRSAENRIHPPPFEGAEELIRLSNSYSLPWQRVVYLSDQAAMHFRFVPPGSFLMGSPVEETGRQNDEGPVHKISIEKPFYLGVFEVTQRQWNAVMDFNPSVFRYSEDHPVDSATWNQCQDFIRRLNTLNLGHFRLPSEAEWEYAARAGTTTRFYWGDDPEYREIYSHARFNPVSHGRSHPVGTRKPNPWGFHDIAGNMWEWTADLKKPYPGWDPDRPFSRQDEYVFRGGSWFNPDHVLRSANRNSHPPDIPYTSIGLRLVLETD